MRISKKINPAPFRGVLDPVERTEGFLVHPTPRVQGFQERCGIKEKNGQSLVEVAIGLTIGAILISAAAFAISYTLRANTTIQKSQSASAFNQELMDKVRALAGANWQTLYGLTKGTSTSYYLNASGTSYTVLEGKEGVLDNDVMNGLVGYWKFDEASGTTAFDSSGNSNGGILTNGPTRTTSTCKVSYCLSFDPASSQYVGMSTISISGSITVAAWVNSANNSQNGFVVGKNPVNTQWELFYEGGYIKWRGGSSGGDGELAVAPPTVDTWFHVVVVQTGTIATMYINGAMSTSGTVAVLGNGSGTVEVGRFDAGYYFNGKIDEVRIYNGALTADEVRRLWNSNVYSRFFNVENASRDSGGSIVTSGGTDDPSTQKVTTSVQWGLAVASTEAKIVDYVTRWKNFVFRQTDWSGGSGQSGVITEPNDKYSASDNIDTSTRGSIKILNL